MGTSPYMVAWYSGSLFYIKSRQLHILFTFPIGHQTKIVADDILIFYFYLSKEIMLDFS